MKDFIFREFSSALTAVIPAFWADPTGTLTKVLERMRQSENDSAQKIAGAFLKLFEQSTTGQIRMYSPVFNSDRSFEDFCLLNREDRKRYPSSRNPETLNGSDPDTPGNPIRVGYLLTSAKPFTESGYSERSHQLLNALVERGVEELAVSRLGYPATIGRISRSSTYDVGNVRYSIMMPWVVPCSAEKRISLSIVHALKAFESFQPELIHTTTNFVNAIVAENVARALEIPWVYEVRGEPHNTWLSKQRMNLSENAKVSRLYELYKSREARATQRADAVICLSQVSKAKLVNQGVPEGKIEVIPNGIDERVFQQKYSKLELRRVLGLKGNRIVGTVSSIVDYEGLDYLIRALTLIPDVECLIVGEGEKRPLLEQLSKELGLEERVHFIGRVPSQNVWQWYSVLDVFVLPRKNLEVCRSVTPIKAMMAQALGIPVIASDLPALREVTGGVARYFTPESVQDLGEALSEVLELSATDRETLGNKGKEFARKRTWQSNADAMIDLYDRLLQK